MSSIDDNIEFNLSLKDKNTILSNLNEEGKLTCLNAFKVAKKLSIEPNLMSAITKSLKIKITDCELGVFGNLDFLPTNMEVYNSLLKEYPNSKAIPCKNLWLEARKSSLKQIGSVVKNENFQVTYCQLGCFREKKGLKSGDKSKSLD